MDKIIAYFRPKLKLRESKKNSTVFSLKKAIKKPRKKFNLGHFITQSTLFQFNLLKIFLLRKLFHDTSGKILKFRH